MLHEAVTPALEIEATYEAKSWNNRRLLLRLVQEPQQEEKSKLIELLTQNTAAIDSSILAETIATPLNLEREQELGLG